MAGSGGQSYESNSAPGRRIKPDGLLSVISRNRCAAGT
jgi:hypothetical protein